MDRLGDAFNERDTLELILQDYPIVNVMEGMSSLSTHISWMINLLEIHLEAIWENGAFRSYDYYYYLITNACYIVRKVRDTQLDTILGRIWLQEQSAKICEYIKRCGRISSWIKVLDFLKLDSNGVTAESMKGKLRLFNEQFPEMFREQSLWLVLDEQLMESLILVFVLAYEYFIERFRDILLDQADEHITYSTSRIESCLRRILEEYLELEEHLRETRLKAVREFIY
ncbi:hypothetical protein PIB30_087507 [Stylosanthes scabra]|uniref:Exocyst subunit Exo70 family protein n=1 Tax=Stylosanthes scabra TaxID=79078 RepID=A0ABU6UV92_9FABA|nr:hypothetical protein [Stylosanthes scabra]